VYPQLALEYDDGPAAANRGRHGPIRVHARCFRFQIDRGVEIPSDARQQIPEIAGTMRAQLRFFCDYHRSMAKLEPLFSGGSSPEKRLEKSQLETSFPFRIGVRKMCADVAKSRGANSASQIGVPARPANVPRALAEMNFDSAKNEFAPFSARR